MRRKSHLILLTTQALSMLLVLILLLFSGYTRGEQIAMDALSHLGKPYVFGAAGPDRFDCSGLIRYCFAGHGIFVEHSAQAIGTNPAYRTVADPKQLRVGDVVCFDTVQDSDPSDHVGIWIGGNEFVHASSGQGKLVVSSLEGYYADHYTWGKRLICPYF